MSYLFTFHISRLPSKENIGKACKKLVPSVNSGSTSELPVDSISLGMEYDLFISYSHKDTEIATSIYDYIRKRKPHWKIFIDQQNLNAGTAWQTKLYRSIGRFLFLLLQYICFNVFVIKGC